MQLLYRKRWDRVRLLPAELDKVQRAVAELPGAMSGQFHNLNISALQQTRHKGVFRLKVPPFRVIFQQVGQIIVVLELDRRDEGTYKHLDRLVYRRVGDGVEIVEAEESSEAAVRTVRGREPDRGARRSEHQNPLTPFTGKMLQDLGLDDSMIAELRSARETVDIADVVATSGLDPDVVELIVDAWYDPKKYLAIFDEGRVPAIEDARLGLEELAQRLASKDSRTSVAELDPDDLERILLAPIDEWMFYLHPSQARVVEHAPTGPSRVRGGPGSGKTVAALHRAKYLLRNGHADSVLLTTFVRVLPATWDRLLHRFAVEQADCITTCTVDALARQIVVSVDGEPNILADDQARDRIAEDALRTAHQPRRSPQWFLTEIDAVIAGSGLSSVDEYLAVDRAGRGSRLTGEDRRQVWTAYENYVKRLTRQSATDFAHLRLRALELARSGHGPRFDAVIVDEAQDLTRIQVELLKALHDDPEHRAFMVLGDGQQSIYPGGFSLRSVDLDVRGRSWVLRSNWRNTQRVMDVARVVLGDQEVRDLEEEGAVPKDAAPPRRLGEAPELHVVESVESASSLLVDLLHEALVDLQPSDIAILGRKNAIVKDRIEPAVRRAAAASIRLTALPKQQDGAPNCVRVGTFEYSKGLEFKLVILVGPDRPAWSVSPYWLNERDDQTEWWNSERRRLFVAMTRARDRLVLVAGDPLPHVLREAAPQCSPWEWR